MGFSINAFAQQSRKIDTDSLGFLFERGISDSIKVRSGLKLASYWIGKDNKKASAYLNKTEILTGKDPYLKALQLFYKAELHGELDYLNASQDFDRAEKALAGFRQQEAFRLRAKCWFYRVTLIESLDKQKEALDLLINKVLPLADQGGDRALLGSYYLQVGVMLMYIASGPQADYYFQQAIRHIPQTSANRTLRLHIYFNAAINHSFMNQPQEAAHMLDQVRNATDQLNEDGMARYCYAESLYLNATGQFLSALKFADQSIRIAKKIDQNFLEGAATLEQAKAMLSIGKKEAAQKILLLLLKENDYAVSPFGRRLVFEKLALVEALLGNPAKAYQWQQRYSKLSDSINDSRLRDELSRMEMKFRNVEHLKMITTLESEKIQSAMTAKNTRLLNYFLVTVILLLLLGGLFALLYYRNIRKLAIQKQINDRQQKREAEQERQLELSQAIIEGAESERRRLARDLHDGLGGMLAGVKINLSALYTSAQREDIAVDMPKIIRQLDNSANELRRIARNLMPETLLRLGLTTAVKDLCESMLGEQVQIDFQFYGDFEGIREDVQLSIYRIIQELMNNTLRHSAAKDIVLQCSLNDGKCLITLEDDGIGFVVSEVSKQKGIGLQNIKNRVNYLGGNVQIHSIPGEGTTIHIELNVDTRK